MLRNVPVGAGRRKNKPVQTRSQDTANPGPHPGEHQGLTVTSPYQGPSQPHHDFPPTALCTLHAASSASLPHENHGGVPAGTMSAMTGTSALHGAHMLRCHALATLALAENCLAPLRPLSYSPEGKVDLP